MKKTKLGNLVVKNRFFILIVSLLLIIPSIMGMLSTRINYDVLSYLPSDIETVEGQSIIQKDFNIGSYSIILVDSSMPAKDILKIEDKIKEISCVDKIASGYDVLGTTIPKEYLPENVKSVIDKDGVTPIIVTFTSGMGDDETLNAITQMRKIVGKQCKISSISASNLDIKETMNREMAIYIAIAAVLCLLVLAIALDSYIVPFILLGGIGIAILYNMGSNIVLGQISYITQAIAAVLQLGVTMDFSIFLYHSYMRNKKTEKDKYSAMANAINETFLSVVGSSTTTIAGFLALCTMQLALGKDIGLVMAKGVLIGVISVVTLLPSIVLLFDNLIEKTSHKDRFPKFERTKKFVAEKYKGIIIVFILISIPAIYGNSHVNVYYNLLKSLPNTLDSVQADAELSEKFNIKTTEIVLVNKDLSDTKINEMVDEIENYNGVENVLCRAKLSNMNIPDSMIPEDVKNLTENDKYQLILINSSCENATDEANALINNIKNTIKKYDENAILAGEGPLMKDLVEIADHDFNAVNVASIGVVLVLMFLVFKSGSIPVILTVVIEFAIFVNTSCAYYTGVTLPFIATIIIGTIQLGSTVDYAILMTNKYLTARSDGLDKKKSAIFALDNSMNSIIVSALCFCASTLGVSLISKIDLVGSICTLLSRGAIVSMLVVILTLPSFLILFDKLICKTTVGMKNVLKEEK